MKALRVLHVIPSISEKHGGPSYAIKSMAHSLQQGGVDVVIATTDDDGGGARLNVPLGVPVKRDDVTLYFFRRDLLPYKVSFGLRRWLYQNVANFDVVHIHALFSFSSTVAARAAQRHRIPYIVRPLGVLNRWGLEHRRPIAKQLSVRLIERRNLERAALIHYTTEREKAEALEAIPEIAAVRSCVIPLIVKTGEGSGLAEGFRGRFSIDTSTPLILFLSRIDKKKGIELLLKAFSEVRQKDPKCRLVIAGDGASDYLRSLREVSRRLGVDSAMIWTGFLHGDDKRGAFAAASLFVLPSFSENFGIAAAEAMACGVPTILTQGVGLSDEVEAAAAAVVVEPTSGELAQAISRLLSSSEERELFSKRGRALATNRFSARSVGNELMKAYEQLASRTRPAT